MITSFIEMLELPYFDHMTKSTILQPCLLKEPLKTQKSRKNQKLRIKMQSISVFLDIIKVADFW